LSSLLSFEQIENISLQDLLQHSSKVDLDKTDQSKQGEDLESSTDREVDMNTKFLDIDLSRGIFSKDDILSYRAIMYFYSQQYQKALMVKRKGFQFLGF
jgi:hypothetical protein